VVTRCFFPRGSERYGANACCSRADACAELHVSVDTRALKEIVAKKIIAHAQRGERDPILLRDVVVAELRQEAISGA
jgi:hypothetical protein